MAGRTISPEDLATLAITDRPAGSWLTVQAKPRASRTAILGVKNRVLDVALAAPPVDGAANDELVRVMAEALELPKRDVVIVAGESSKRKVVEVRGLDSRTVRARLARLV